MSERPTTEQEYTIGRMGLKIPAIDRYVTGSVWHHFRKFPDGYNVSCFINEILELNGIEPTGDEHVPRELAIPATDNKPTVIVRSTRNRNQILTTPETPGSFVEVLGYHGDKLCATSEYNFTEGSYDYAVGSTYFMGRNLAISDSDFKEYKTMLFREHGAQINLYEHSREIIGQYYQASLEEALEETVKLLS